MISVIAELSWVNLFFHWCKGHFVYLKEVLLGCINIGLYFMRVQGSETKGSQALLIVFCYSPFLAAKKYDLLSISSSFANDNDIYLVHNFNCNLSNNSYDSLINYFF